MSGAEVGIVLAVAAFCLMWWGDRRRAQGND